MTCCRSDWGPERPSLNVSGDSMPITVGRVCKRARCAGA